MINYSSDDRLYHIGVAPQDVGKYVILPGDPGRCEKISQFFDNPKLMGENREYKTYTGTLLGERVSVTSTGIGGPSASIAMEELKICGAHTFIRVGTCGGMDLAVESGDCVIATGAIRMEGTSKEYAPMEWPAVADFDVSLALKEAAKKLQTRYHMGVVECKDSFYGQHSPETKPVSYELLNKWEAWCRLGSLASEMESAALFTVAAALNLRVGTVLLAVANQERAKRNMPNPIVHDIDMPIKVAIEALKLLIEEDRKSNQENNDRDVKDPYYIKRYNGKL